MMEKVAAGKIVLKTFHTLDEVLGDASGVTGIRSEARRQTAAPRTWNCKAASSPSAIRPTPRSSRANWPWKTATS
jgi:hypothetical protein